MKNQWIGLVMLVTLVAVLVTDAFTTSAHQSKVELQQASLLLDGVGLTLVTPILPADFISPDPDNAIQVTTAVKWNDFQEISITAAPFGFKASTEGLPVAEAGVADAYRTILQDFRKQQGGTPQIGPTANLFGKQITSSVSVVNLNIAGPEPRPVVITEWVVEAGNRVWILRVSQNYKGEQDSQNAIASFVSFLSDVALNSADVNHPSTSAAARNHLPIPLPNQVPIASADDLPFPSWWDGDCDTNHYHAQTGIWAYPLGGSYRGVKACGPRPYGDGAPDVLVQFFPGAWGEYEWQCVEFSMRYLYLAYNIHPYSANGADVVWNYSGGQLDKISNGTVNHAPEPGDVLSYAITAPYGHTSVVAASSVNSSGNGSITIIEQNGASSGSRTHTVSNWYVQDSQSVSGWLHDPAGGDATPPDTSITSGPTGWVGANDVTFQWTGSDNQTPTTNLVYSYKLDGYSDWSAWTSNTSKTYSNPPDRSYTFQVKAKDESGNIDPSPAARSFSIDASPPTPPNINISGSGCGGIQNNSWQNTCHDPAFTWSASDSGSGVQDYHYYWGTLSNGSPDTWTDDAGFDPDAIAPENGYAAYYLNVTARDNLDHKSSLSSFGVLYDGIVPTAALEINNGAKTSNQVDVVLYLSAADAGSGIADARFSNNGVNWSDWQTFADQNAWTLAVLDRYTHTVYAQVRDYASNESAVVSDAIYLDLYPPMPHSSNYRICADVIDAGGSGELGSSSYSLISAIGQAWNSGANPNSGGDFNERSGFLANITGCLPITGPVPSGITITQWVVASGGNLRESNSYRLGDTAGETAASSANAFTSANFTLSSGFWSQISGTLPPAPPPPPPTPITPTPSPSPTPGPTPTPQPGGFGLNINSSDPATNNPTVIVNAWGPNVTRMRLDNQNEYADEGWISYQPTTTWMISTAGEYITPRYVYGWFKDAQDVVYGPYFDSIIYDPVAPQGSVMILGGEFVTVPLWLDAWDDNSGVNQMRIAEDADLTDAAWQPYTNTVIWVLQNPVVYAQFHDQASNQSLIYGSDGSSQASDSRPISISITGPAIGITDQEHALLATVDPITATRPITYTWQATGQTPVTHTNSMQVSDAISFTWSATGMQTITVTASNRIGSASGVFNIVISTGACDIFLPVVLRQWP